jgi:REP element-mobilizing transposase RayT
MARKLRVQFEGAIYHVTIRGVERRRIFDDGADRERFLKRLGEAVEEYGVRLYLFCCMVNHVHILCETPQANLSAFMHKLQTAYTVYYNLRHRRAGHLTQGRFGAEPVQGDTYLLKLSRYIHLNPVFVGTMKKEPPEVRREYLRRYPWSSYRGYAGLGKPYDFVAEAPILALTHVPAKKRRRAYRRFVETGIAQTDAEFLELLKDSPWGIGATEFQNRIRDLHTDRAENARRKEDVPFRRVVPTVSATAVLDAVAKEFGIEPAALRRRQYDCVARAVAAYMLGRHAGMNQRDIGAFLGMGTGSAVCRQLRRLRECQARDPTLENQLQRIRLALDAAAQHPSRSTISLLKG